MYSSIEYPRNFSGDMIWKDSDYVVVAVIKIHFRPYTIRINSHETRVIKKLSRSLGTELLSYQLRQDTMKALQELSRDRLNACNILADSLRNAITKSGLIFSLVKQEIGFLRDQWEQALLSEFNQVNWKEECIKKLNNILSNIGEEHKGLKEVLSNAHNKFLELSLPPGQGERWVALQIEDKWNDLLNRNHRSSEEKETIRETIEDLKRSLQFGRDPQVVAEYHRIPEDIKERWVNLIYQENEKFSPSLLDNIIELLDNPDLKMPSQEKSKKTLLQLKALAETMNQLERNTNFLLHQVLNGNGNKEISKSVLSFINAPVAQSDRAADF
jgi:hypothetical protein